MLLGWEWLVSGSTATGTISAIAVVGGFGRGVVILAFGFLRMAFVGAGAIEGFDLFWWDRGVRLDVDEVLAVGLLAIEVDGSFADRVALVSLHGVVIVHLFEGPFIDDGPVAFEARTLCASPCLDGDGAELDACNGLPWRVVALEDFDAVESRFLEGLVNSSSVSAPLMQPLQR
ncbi:MAG: hypothetical protein ACJAVK_002766 [Akkermansiaceae bacterium]|jgi:hypothetical protein